MIDAGLYIAYVLLILATVTAIILPVVNAVKTPGALMKSLIGVGFLVVLFGISYALSGSSVSADNAARGITETTSKLIGAGLTMLYLSLILAFVALVYSEISKALK